jgi:hypothetical protein
MEAEPLFRYMRERHAIHLRRQGGKAWPWTMDPVLQQYRFCNVYRELDRTTIWFREHVRESLRSSPDVLLATVLFRWFNRITTGEAIFQQYNGLVGRPGTTAWDLRGNTSENWKTILRQSIRSYVGRGPYVTGSYIIKTPDGMDKLEGVLWCVEQFMTLKKSGTTGVLQDLRPFDWRWLGETLLADPGHTSLESVWSWLRRFPYLGDFMAYEIVTDLRHTDLLCRAPDIMTWANPGPGAMRGLNRLAGRDLNKRLPKSHYIEEMQELLRMSRDSQLWPVAIHDEIELSTQYLLHDKMEPGMGDIEDDLLLPQHWPMLEMRDIEHSLCELDKYERARLGEGRPRGVYRHG